MTRLPPERISTVTSVETYFQLCPTYIVQQDPKEVYADNEANRLLQCLSRAINLRELYITVNKDCRPDECEVRKRIDAIVPQLPHPDLNIVVEQIFCEHCRHADRMLRELWIWRRGNKAAHGGWETIRRKGEAEIGAIGVQCGEEGSIHGSGREETMTNGVVEALGYRQDEHSRRAWHGDRS